MAKVLTDALTFQAVAIYVLSLVGGKTLDELLGETESVNLAMHMMIVDLVTPALVTSVVGGFIELFTFDILPVEEFYDYFYGSAGVAPTKALSTMKYDSESFIRNTGSIVVFFWLCLYIMFQIWFIGKIVLPD